MICLTAALANPCTTLFTIQLINKMNLPTKKRVPFYKRVYPSHSARDAECASPTFTSAKAYFFGGLQNLMVISISGINLAEHLALNRLFLRYQLISNNEEKTRKKNLKIKEQVNERIHQL
jgi:hypothetical protein